MKIIYEPHPVTPKRKAELRAQGYRIVDIRFKPADVEDEPLGEATKQRGRKPKADQPETSQPDADPQQE